MNPIFAEFIGTFLLILLGCGVNANVLLKDTKGNRGSNSGWMLITTGWGLSVYVAVLVTAPYSGAHINPAVTVGLALAGEFPIFDVPAYILAQMAGALAGALLVWYLYADHFKTTADPLIKRGVFCTEPAIYHTMRNVMAEVAGTFVLVFAVLYFADPMIVEGGKKIGLGALGALPVALVVWCIGIALGGTTGYAINPARDLGPRIAHALVPIQAKAGFNWKYAWIPVIGPTIGGALAAVLYQYLEGNLPF
jgi:glycerol uptake facilitator protein